MSALNTFILPWLTALFSLLFQGSLRKTQGDYFLNVIFVSCKMCISLSELLAQCRLQNSYKNFHCLPLSPKTMRTHHTISPVDQLLMSPNYGSLEDNTKQGNMIHPSDSTVPPTPLLVLLPCNLNLVICWKKAQGSALCLGGIKYNGSH